MTGIPKDSQNTYLSISEGPFYSMLFCILCKQSKKLKLHQVCLLVSVCVCVCVCVYVCVCVFVCVFFSLCVFTDMCCASFHTFIMKARDSFLFLCVCVCVCVC